MAYRLTFTDPRLFEFCYNGFHQTAMATTREEHIISNRILDKFESISLPDVANRAVPGFPAENAEMPRMRSLKPEGGFIILEDAQFQYLRSALERIRCIPQASRVVEQLYGLLDGAPHGDAKDLVTETWAAKAAAG